ncbi:adenylate/guanylate cyclase domain-containing protein [Sphingobium subterraneum]|uniref:Adenylate cyclase n=1 Tax=Sphingobium subterraneum TaxID=627688 RepID=A0A841J0B5_9SPHN|nr:adenylate/guanylate cyclase domain-containing protein [Sphingobium subterraneum]MBB6124134.1 adenylate cyclase [Sphingobium subterraneum]
MPRWDRWSRKAKRIWADTGPLRLGFTLLLLAIALLVARYSWNLPLIVAAERGSYDVRTTLFAPRVDQDPRIVMIVYNDQTLIDTRKRSPLDRRTLAQALRTIDAMGAKSIGIDILFDQPQDEDAELLAAFRAMKTPTWIAYANVATNDDQIIYDQQQFLDGFVRSLGGTAVRPASIRLQVDADGVARSWPEPAPGLPELLTRAMEPVPGYARYQGSVRYRMAASEDRPAFASLPIDLFRDPAMAQALADQVRGRHVLIGGDIVDIDQFETPMTATTARTMVGLEVHAQMLAQMLDGPPWKRLPNGALWAVAALVVLAAGLTSLTELRWFQLLPYLGAQLLLFGGLPVWLAWRGVDTQNLPAVGWGLGWVIAFLALGSAARAVGAQQRRFAQSALGKYLPRDIATQIVQEPEKLALHGEKREIFVVFTDLEGFTKLSHSISPELVASLLNRYLDALSDVVLAHGGTIDKFVGDAVVAFWGAPIARPDDGTNAAKAAYAMWQAGEAFRRHLPEGVASIGKTRVGLHWGEAIVGNFGGEGRIQYTALGDSMNTAARLESANKSLDSSVMASREAMERSGLDWWRPMGRVVLRGRATPVEIFEPAPDFPASDVHHLQDILNGLLTNRQQGLSDLAALVARYPDDAALQNLYMRVEHTPSGEAYVLD